DLLEWPADAWLAFDDYHFAAESEASERYVDLVASLSPVRLLLASRKRPAWATSRRILYGDVHEWGTHELTMTQTEVARVLEAGGRRSRTGFTALAEGWPAVIGLAAASPDVRLPDGEFPSALHSYLAEELYQAAKPDVRWGLCQLA